MSVPIQSTSMVSPLMVASMYELGSLELVCFHVPVRSAGWGLGSSLLVSVFDVPSDLAGASAVVLPPQADRPVSNIAATSSAIAFFMIGLPSCRTLSSDMTQSYGETQEPRTHPGARGESSG